MLVPPRHTIQLCDTVAVDESRSTSRVAARCVSEFCQIVCLSARLSVCNARTSCQFRDPALRLATNANTGTMAGRFGWLKLALALAHARGQEAMSKGPKHKLWAWLWADRDVVLDAVRHCGWYLKYASTELRADREVVLTAVMEAGSALKYASVELRADLEVVLVAMEGSWIATRTTSSYTSALAHTASKLYIPTELRADPEAAGLRLQRLLYRGFSHLGRGLWI